MVTPIERSYQARRGDAVEVFDLGCWTDHESRLSSVIELNESHD